MEKSKELGVEVVSHKRCKMSNSSCATDRDDRDYDDNLRREEKRKRTDIIVQQICRKKKI